MSPLFTGVVVTPEELSRHGYDYKHSQVSEEVKPIHHYVKDGKTLLFVENQPQRYMFLYGLKGA